MVGAAGYPAQGLVHPGFPDPGYQGVSAPGFPGGQEPGFVGVPGAPYPGAPELARPEYWQPGFDRQQQSGGALFPGALGAPSQGPVPGFGNGTPGSGFAGPVPGPFAEQQFAGQPLVGQPFQGQEFQGQQFAGQSYPGQPYPAQEPGLHAPGSPGWSGPGSFLPGEAYPVGGGQPYPGDPRLAGNPGLAGDLRPEGPPGYPAPGYPGAPGLGGPGGGPYDPRPFPGHGAFQEPAPFPGPGGYPPGGFPGQQGFSEPVGYPMAAGYGAPAAPYTGFPDWQQAGAPGGHRGREHGEFANGGDYAYVIREDDPAAASQSRATEWGRLGEWAPGNAAPLQDHGQVPGSPRSPGAPAGSASVRGRAITSGAASDPAAAGPLSVQPASVSSAAVGVAAANSASVSSTVGGPVTSGPAAVDPAASVPDADTVGGARDAAAPVAAIALGGPAPAEAASGVMDPDLAYGPDDPGYGPPGPDWYRRAEEAPVGSVALAQKAQAGESLTERGPFEPAQHDERPYVGQPPEDGDGAQPVPETPDLLDFGPDDPAAGALGGLRSLYQTAEAIGFDRLERNLDRLLDRQRKLITDYFTESGDLGPADLDTPPVSVGFASADSLAGLRGGPTSTPPRPRSSSASQRSAATTTAGSPTSP